MLIILIVLGLLAIFTSYGVYRFMNMSYNRSYIFKKQVDNFLTYHPKIVRLFQNNKGLEFKYRLSLGNKIGIKPFVMNSLVVFRYGLFGKQEVRIAWSMQDDGIYLFVRQNHKGRSDNQWIKLNDNKYDKHLTGSLIFCCRDHKTQYIKHVAPDGSEAIYALNFESRQGLVRWYKPTMYYNSEHFQPVTLIIWLSEKLSI